MTNAAGQVLISYKRESLADVEVLARALLDHGIPIWQDVADLGAGLTQDEIRRILADDNTAALILYITPEVAGSPMILDVEAPLAVARAQREGHAGFFVVPVAAGGLGWRAAARIFDGKLGAVDLATCHIVELPGGPLGAGDAASVAARVLRERIGRLHRQLPAGEPLRLRINARIPLAKDGGSALHLDWSACFAGRFATPAAWDRFKPALRTIFETLHAGAPGRAIEASGQTTLPAAIALGATFVETCGIPITWLQDWGGGARIERWELQAPAVPAPVEVIVTPGTPGVADLAILISTTQDVENAFAATRTALALPLAATVHVRHRDIASAAGAIRIDAASAASTAYRVQAEIRAARTTYRAAGSIHLFINAPAGLAMMVGQLLNTLGPVVVYEFEQTAAPPYRAEVTLQP